MEIDKKITLICCLFIFIGLFSMTIFSPSLPIITHALNTSREMVKIAITGYLFGYGISQLFYGPIADYLGRKPVIIFALTIVLFGNVITALSWAGWIFVVGHIIAGLGAGSGSTVTRAIIKDTHVGHAYTRSLSLVILMATLGTNSGPVIGGFIQQYFGWRFNFWFIVLASLLIITFALIALPETIEKKHALNVKTILINYFNLLRHRFFMGHALIIGLIFSASIAYFTLTPFLYQVNLHLTPAMNGTLMIIPIICIFSGTFTMNFLLHKINQHIIMVFGISLYFIGGISMLVAALLHVINVYVILIPSLCLYFSLGLINPLFTGNGIKRFTENIGLVSALQGSLKVLVAAIAGIFFAKIIDQSLLPLACIYLSIAVLILSFYLIAYHDQF